MNILKIIILTIGIVSLLQAQEMNDQNLHSKEQKLAYFNQVIDTLRQATHNPGMAISVIYDDDIILMKGIGSKDLDTKQPVTTKTIFHLGSIAKGMTGFIGAQLVDEGRMEWNDPVIRHLSDFKMSNDYLTQHVTIKDLMTHQTGLAQHYYLMYGPQFERDNIINLLPEMGLSGSLRETYLYNNFTFTVAGILEERITGASWEELVETRIFRPLNMNNSYNQFPKQKDIATSYSRDGITKINEPQKVNTGGDTYAPAGGLYSDIEDITKWTQLLIHKGIINNDTLISSKQFSYITNPLVVRYANDNRFYGIGWDITTTNKYHTIAHNGVTAGQKARILFIPELGFGISVLCNQYSDLPSALTKFAEDIFIYGKKTSLKEAITYFENQVSDKKNKEPLKEYKIPQDRISLPITAYCGKYFHPAYGLISITAKGNDQLHFSYYDFIGGLEHIMLSKFIAHTNHSTGKDDFPIHFNVENQTVNEFEIKFPAAPKMIFIKDNSSKP